MQWAVEPVPLPIIFHPVVETQTWIYLAQWSNTQSQRERVLQSQKKLRFKKIQDILPGKDKHSLIASLLVAQRFGLPVSSSTVAFHDRPYPPPKAFLHAAPKLSFNQCWKCFTHYAIHGMWKSTSKHRHCLTFNAGREGGGNKEKPLLFIATKLNENISIGQVIKN